jgi:hypothetical protein
MTRDIFDRNAGSAGRLLFMLACGLFLPVAAAGAAPSDSAAAKPDTVAAAPDTAGSDSAAAPDSAASADSTKKSTVDTIRYEADDIHYSVDGKLLYLKGKGVIRYQDVTLFADTIEYRIAEDLFIAHGSPQLVEAADTTVGEEMVYNIKTRRGKVRYASTHMTDGFFNGQDVVKQENNVFHVHDGDYTTCAYPLEPHYYFYGKNTKVIPNDKIVSRPVVFNIAEVPVAALPYFIFPLQRGRQSGFLTPVFGGHPGDKGYLDNIGYYFAINDYSDAKVWGRIQEFQDWVMGGSGQYALKYWLNGNISGRYAQGSEFLEKSSEWSVDYSHGQNLTPDALTRLEGRGSLVSSKRFYTDVSKDSVDFLQPDINATMSLSRRFESINASANVMVRRDHKLSRNDISDQVPSFSFSLPSRPLIPFKPPAEGGGDGGTEGGAEEARWYNKIYCDYRASGQVRRQKYGADSLKDYLRAGLQQETSLLSPQTIFSYLTVSPNLRARFSVFDAYMTPRVVAADTGASGPPKVVYDTIEGFGDPESLYVYGWNAGVSLQTRLFGLFPVRIFNFAGLRHVLTPTVGYTFTPEHRLQRRYFSEVAGYEQDHDRSQVIRFGLDNQFDGKTVAPPQKEGEKPKENKFTIVNGSVSASYDFEAGERKWSDLQVSAGTNYRRIGLGYGSSYWLYDENGELSPPILRSYSVRLDLQGGFGASGSLWDGDLFVLEDVIDKKEDPVEYRSAGPQSWQFGLAPTYSFSASRSTPRDIFISSHQYGLSASAGLGYTRKWRVSWGGYYNFAVNQLVGHSLNFTCDLECWDLRFNWRPSGINPGYYFIVNLKKIPEIKWEKKD